MITLTILSVIVIAMVVISAITVIVGGAGFVVIFADVLIGLAFVYFVFKYLISK